MGYPLGIETNARAIPGSGGRHWRSAAPDELEAHGWESLRAASVTTVIDLRNPSEIPAECSCPAALTVIRAPLEDVDDPAYAELWDHNWAHPQFYLWGVTRWSHLWDVAFTAIADAPGGVLLHCAGGRDRTGLLVSVLLDRAGVDRAVVLDDYEAGLRGSTAMLIARGEPDHPAAVPADQLESFVTTYRAALDGVLDLMPAAIENAALADVADRAARQLVAPTPNEARRDS